MPDTPMTPTPPTRIRLTFATSGALAYLSVLDMGRLWERCLRRARVPMRYTQGFNPHPRLQMGAPLPVGCSSQGEWLDCWLDQPWTPQQLLEALAGQTPAGLTLLDAVQVPENAPALEGLVVAAEYRLWVQGTPLNEVQAAAERLLAAESLPRERRGKAYDLRPLVEALTVSAPAGDSDPIWTAELYLKVTVRPGATGRPDEVLDALGLGNAPRRCVRLRMLTE